MLNFRTSSLFHYTKFNYLKKILETGITPNYCKEEFGSESVSKYVVGIPMVSFCDIPLTRTDTLTKRYGNHAIGFSKEWALKNGINPIMYVSNENIILSLRFFKSYEMSLKSQLIRNGCNGRQLTLNLFDQNSVSNIVPFINHNNAKFANLNFWGYTKPYWGYHNKKKQCNYEENEWRYVPKEENGIEWKWGEQAYSEWRGDMDSEKPQPNEALINRKLKFSCKDITNIIVEYDSQILGVVKTIESLTMIGGNSNNEITEDEKKILISKIVSFERIKKDF